MIRWGLYSSKRKPSLNSEWIFLAPKLNQRQTYYIHFREEIGDPVGGKMFLQSGKTGTQTKLTRNDLNQNKRSPGLKKCITATSQTEIGSQLKEPMTIPNDYDAGSLFIEQTEDRKNWNHFSKPFWA